jgi:hypothetical protein
VFVTSDNPAVTIIDAPDGRGFYRGGLGSPYAEVTLPLSPSRVLLAHWRADQASGYLCTREMVRKLNRMRAGYAERAIYADRCSDGLWRLARNHVGAIHRDAGEDSEEVVRMVRTRSMVRNERS